MVAPPSDASIVFIEGRSLTMARPGRGVYHLSRRWGVTRCGRIIWTSNRGDDRKTVTLVPIRRDNASRIARPCRICGADDDAVTETDHAPGCDVFRIAESWEPYGVPRHCDCGFAVRDAKRRGVYNWTPPAPDVTGGE